jgi:uncharacterized coiled-coil protein SlyX
MKPETSYDQIGACRLARYRAALAEISETIRQTKQTIERSQELLRRLDGVIDDDRQPEGQQAVTAVNRPPEIIVIVPADWAQFRRVVMGLSHH